MMRPKRGALLLFAGAAVLGLVLMVAPSRASDHDDGSTGTKTPNLNLTDLYVFMEKTYVNTASDDSMIFVMNVNPRALPATDQFFNDMARYEFHVGRVGTADKNDDLPTGKADVDIRFEFKAPDTNNVQDMTVTAIKAGAAGTPVTTVTGGAKIQTTPYKDRATPKGNEFKLDGTDVTLFAGLRQDPFFFDVNAFFKLRADAAAAKPAGEWRKFKSTGGDDFTAGSNILSIVLKIPRTFFRGTGDTTTTTFDTWETISVPEAS